MPNSTFRAVNFQKLNLAIHSLNRFFSGNSPISNHFDEILFQFQERIQVVSSNVEFVILLVRNKECWLYGEKTKRKVSPQYRGFYTHIKPVRNFQRDDSLSSRFVLSIGQFFKKPKYIFGLPNELISGNRFWILLNAKSPGFFENKAFFRFYSIFQKLTSQLSETEYKKLNREIEVFKFQEQAVVTLAHQLKSPLSAIESALHAIKYDSKNQKNLLIEGMNKIKTTRKLIDEYIGFMKITQISLTSIPLQFFKKEIENYYRFAFSKNEIKLKVEIEKEDEFTRILAHPVMAMQAIQNIIDNAQQAIGQSGEIFLSIGKNEMSTHENMVLFIFSDSGPGVAAGQSERIFEPFISGSTTGHGLGLSICRRIITLHGGSVEHIPKGTHPKDRFIMTFKSAC